jgi:hypothetical protein
VTPVYTQKQILKINKTISVFKTAIAEELNVAIDRDSPSLDAETREVLLVEHILSIFAGMHYGLTGQSPVDVIKQITKRLGAVVSEASNDA